MQIKRLSKSTYGIMEKNTIRAIFVDRRKFKKLNRLYYLKHYDKCADCIKRVYFYTNSLIEFCVSYDYRVFLYSNIMSVIPLNKTQIAKMKKLLGNDVIHSIMLSYDLYKKYEREYELNVFHMYSNKKDFLIWKLKNAV